MGDRKWWATRDAEGRMVSLILVDVFGPRYRLDGPAFEVQSVRSGSRYVALASELLPLSTAADPDEHCAVCGAPRGSHNKRHKFRSQIDAE